MAYELAYVEVDNKGNIDATSKAVSNDRFILAIYATDVLGVVLRKAGEKVVKESKFWTIVKTDLEVV